MKLLALETSTKQFSLAVSDGARICARRNVVLRRVLSSSIIPGIRAVLTKAGMKLDDIDGFAVGLGPGSFTGLRVGLATIKGLAFALGKPIVGIPSLDVLAHGIWDEVGADVCAVGDARRGLLYSGFYTRAKNGAVKKRRYMLAPAEEVVAQWISKTVLIGDALDTQAEAIRREARRRNIEIRFAPPRAWYPDAAVLIRLAGARFAEGETNDPFTLTPFYMYPADCQVRQKK